MNNNLVILGRFASCYGVQGWIKINSSTEPADNILKFAPHWLIKQNNQWQPIQIDDCKRHGKHIVAKIHGIDDRDVVRQYTNIEIAIKRELLPKPKEDEFYLHDLRGIEVYNQDQILLGTIADFYDAGSNDVFIIKGDKEHWIPYTDAVVKNIDLNNKRIDVDWDPEF